MATPKRFTIGDFSMGKIGTKYFVYKDKWIKYLEETDFHKAIDEAYREVCKYCRSIKLPSPPKPKLEL